MSIAEKLTAIAENQEKVYKAGQNSMIDESKIISKTVTGNPIYLDDVSEIPHDVKISASGYNLLDESAIPARSTIGDIVCDYEGNGILHIYGNYTNNTSSTVYRTFVSVNLNIPIENPGDLYTMYAKLIYKDDLTRSVNCNLQTSNGTETASWGSATVTTSAEVGETVTQTLNCTSNQSDPKLFKTLQIYSAVPTGEELSIDIRIQVWLSKGNELFEYQPHKLSGIEVIVNDMTYITNDDGEIEGVKSLSPDMYINTTSDNVDISVNYHKSYGMQTQYDRFWETYQNKGSRNVYNYAFYDVMWRDKNYNPKYPIKSVNGNSIFQSSSITDTKVTVDLSECKTTAYSTFQNCKNLVKIRKLIVNEDLGYSSFFSNCTSLTDISIEGIIGKNISFAQSPLNAESMKNIISHLKDNSKETGSSSVLTLKDECKTILEDEGNTSPNNNLWTEYVSDLGWTLA